MFNFLDQRHWSLFLKLFNHSFKTAFLPKAWKDTRMILLAKKESICLPSLTRPISLIDSFLKVKDYFSQDFGYKCSLTTAPPCFIIYIYMTEQDKNSIGLSCNQRLIKRKRKKRDRWQKRTSQQLY